MRKQDSGQRHRHSPHWQALHGRFGTEVPEPPDLDACLLHQKLQMLDCCIFMSRHPQAGFITAKPVMRHEHGAAVATAAGLDAPDSAMAAASPSFASSPLAAEVARLCSQYCANTRQSVGSSNCGGDAESCTEYSEAAESAASTSEYASCSDDLVTPADIEAPPDSSAASIIGGHLSKSDAGHEQLIRFPAIQLRLPSPVTSDMVAEREAALAALGECASAASFLPK